MARERGKGKPRHHMVLGTLAFLVLVITVAAGSRKSPDRFGQDTEFKKVQVQVAPEVVPRFRDKVSAWSWPVTTSKGLRQQAADLAEQERLQAQRRRRLMEMGRQNAMSPDVDFLLGPPNANSLWGHVNRL